ncbi:MAG: sodium-independent anion transporter, partial [Pseudomonadota bacterium]
VAGRLHRAGHGMGGGEWLSGAPLWMMLGLVAVTMAIIWVMPRLTRAIPAPLAGIGIVAGLVIAFGLDVPRVGDLASIEGGLPAFHIPMVPLNLETLQIILPYAVILAAIGLVALGVVLSFYDTNIQKDIESTEQALGLILAALAVGMVLIAVFWSGWRTLQIEDTLKSVMLETAKTTSLVFIILLGAAMLTSAFR